MKYPRVLPKVVRGYQARYPYTVEFKTFSKIRDTLVKIEELLLLKIVAYQTYMMYRFGTKSGDGKISISDFRQQRLT